MLSSSSLAFVCVLGWSPPSPAPKPTGSPARPELSDDERAKVLQLYEDGKVLFNAGQYTAAIEAFESAYALSRDDTFLFNIALAQDRLGDLALALDTMQRYRASLPAEGQGPIDQRIRGLKIRIAAQASAAEPTPDPDLDPDQPDDPIVEPQGPPCPDPVLPPAPSPPDAPRLFTPAAIGLAASAGAVLVASGVLGGLSLGARRRADDSCVGGGDTFRCSTSASDDLRVARRTAVAADVTLAIGTGLAIGTAVLLINNGSKRRRSPQLRASTGGVALSF
ncbi:MAG: tetratricopeptide repeat protein [Nannocystales bacterium]